MDYQLIRSRRKTLAIQLPDPERVVVRAPLEMPLWQIEGFLQEKQDWILRNQAMLQQRQEAVQAVLARERGLYYLGRLCPVVWVPEDQMTTFQKDTFFLPRRPLEHCQKEVITLYHRLTRALVEPLVTQWACILGVSPSSVTVTSAKRRWGSCSGKGRICFSYRLATQPAQAVEYVVVHELCHLKHLDHSPDFWRQVARYLPDYRQRRGRLQSSLDRTEAELTRQGL